MVRNWEEVELLSLSDDGMQNGVFYEVSRKGRGIPLINVGDLYSSAPIDSENVELFDATDEEIKRFAVKDGDLFFTRSSVVASGIAHCNWYQKTQDKKPVVFDSHIIRFKTDISKVVPMYLYLQCVSPKAKRFFVANAKTATMTTIDQTVLGKCPIDLPPLPEQHAIAAVLSDTDAYIAALEKLIAKKQAIKQGAMQELLTGKRRLPGFSGEWITLNLSVNSTLKARIGLQGLTTAEYLNEGYAYLITGTDFANGRIAWNGCHYIEKGRYDQDPNIQINTGDILITKDGTIGKIAIVKELTKKASLNSGVFVVRPKNDAYNSVYVYYVLLSEFFANFLAKLAAGSTINHLYQKDFENFEFIIPPTETEQSAIASILSDMDAEIDVLTAKLVKIKYIKQDMMSQLLTGRIRLVKQDAPAEIVAAPKIVKLPKPETKGHSQQFDDAVMIAGIVNALYSDKYPLGRTKVQKCLYLLRRHHEESTKAFKKKAAGPYADEVRYKGSEPIARRANYIVTTTVEGKGTTFARGRKMSQALGYIERWGRQDDIKWVVDELKFKSVEELELLATVDMAICDLEEAGIPVSVASIKHLIETNEVWKKKLEKQIFSDTNIGRAIPALQPLL